MFKKIIQIRYQRQHHLQYSYDGKGYLNPSILSFCVGYLCEIGQVFIE